MRIPGMRAIILAAAGLALVLVSIMGWVTWRIIQAERRFADEAKSVSIPAFRLADASQNAAPVYEKAMPKERWLENPQRARIKAVLEKGWDPSAGLEPLLQGYAPELAVARQALALPEFDLESGKSSDIRLDTPVRQLAGPLDLVRLFLLQGRYWESRSQPAEAAGSYAAALGVAFHLGQLRNQALLGQLGRVVAMEQAWTPASGVIERGSGGVEDYRLLRDAAARLASGDVDLAAALEREHRLLSQARQLFVKRVWDAYPSFRRGSVLGDYKTFEQRAIETTLRTARENRPEDLDRFFDDIPAQHPGLRFKSWISCFGHPDEFVPCFLSSGQDTLPAAARIPRYSKLFFPYHVRRVQAGLLEAGAAIRLYEFDRGAPPERLAELVPDFLARVPQDPFNAFSELRYRRQAGGWLLYSLGPDRRDDSGAPYQAGDFTHISPAPGDLALKSAALLAAPALGPSGTPTRRKRKLRGRSSPS